MSCTLFKVEPPVAMGQAVLEQLEQLQTQDLPPVVLLQDSPAVLRLKKELCDAGALPLGLTVDTWSAWARTMWSYVGDGRTPITLRQRLLLAQYVLRRAAGNKADSDPHSPGYTALLARLCARALPGFCKGAARMLPRLSQGEQRLVGDICAYSDELKARSLMENAELMELLGKKMRSAGARPRTYLFAGLHEADPSLRALIAGLAQSYEVRVLVSSFANEACTYTDELFSRLSGDYPETVKATEAIKMPGMTMLGTTPEPTKASNSVSSELSELSGKLFLPKEAPVVPNGAVSLMLPAGPLAESRGLSKKIGELADKGYTDILVVTGDPLGVYEGISPFVNNQHISCAVKETCNFGDTLYGRSWIRLIASIAELADLADTEPEPELTEGYTKIRLPKDMSWWPPLGLLDVMRSAISHMSAEKVHALDARWRSNRLLTPSMVLKTCMHAAETSPELASCVSDLLTGKIVSAAKRLCVPYYKLKKNAPEAQQALRVLSEAMACAQAMEDMDIFERSGPAKAVPFSRKARVYLELLSQTRLKVSVERRVSSERACVCVCAAVDAHRHEPRDFDAVILMDQSSDLSALKNPDDAASALLETFGIETPLSAMSRERYDFLQLLSLPVGEFVIERTLFDSAGKKRYPSVIMTELLLAYGLDARSSIQDLIAVFGPSRVQLVGEDTIMENLVPDVVASAMDTAVTTTESPAASKPRLTEPRKASGAVSPKFRELVLPPPEVSNPADSRLVLSASQIETYLECPYKWFSLRRLKLDSKDAAFTHADEGTFAHRVLELTYRELIRSGYSLVQDPDMAKEILLKVFEEHREHQYMLKKGHRGTSQTLVPHTATEAQEIDLMKKHLTAFLDYEAARFGRFYPRACEWKFGGRRPAEYAGVYITGTVDRLDTDAFGHALIVDYKYKSTANFAKAYNVFSGSKGVSSDFELPRHVQSLIYAQIVRRAFPDCTPVGSVYLCAKPPFDTAGAVASEFLDSISGEKPFSKQRRAAMEIPFDLTYGGASKGMKGLLDACEEAIAEKVRALLAGNIEAHPCDKDACNYCPVLGCEKRLQ